MGWRGLCIGLTTVAAGTALLAAAQGAPVATPRDLAGAKAAAAAADARARALDTRADAADDPASRARLQARALAARVERAEAEIAAAEARTALVTARLAAERGELAARQGPVTRLLATLTALARRPALLSIVQPGSVDDLVHTRAVLATVLPAVRERTAALRDEVGGTRALRADAALARRSLEAGHAQLVDAREALAALDDGEGARDRVLSLGEQAREIVDRLESVSSAQEVAAALVRLPGPPLPAAPVGDGAPYRLPVDDARLLTGFGEVSRDGVRARGLALTVGADTPVVAPAGGTVIFARPFRSFGGIVVIDHGYGWQTLVTGLARFSVRRGDMIAAGGAIGRATGGEQPVLVELRRRGSPVDVAQLIG